MKTQNLTKWSNLFSIESKCNLTLAPSLFALELSLFLIVVFVIITDFLIVERAVLAWQIAIFALIVAVILRQSFSLFSQYLPPNALTLDSQLLTAEFNDGQYRILSTSRVAFWGCYLMLSPIKPNLSNEHEYGFARIKSKASALFNTTTKTVFIDRRQLSKAALSHVVFTIKKAQFHSAS